MRESCAKRVLRNIHEWLEGRRVGPSPVPTFNVFIADYVDLDDDKFIKTVIKLNYSGEEEKIEAFDGNRLEVVPEEETQPEVTDLE